jgi:hypothetical protein
MLANPADEWRALTGHYRSMVDEELLELAADFRDLTPTAQQALRDEMRLRKLGDPQTPASAPEFTPPPIPPPAPPPGSQDSLLDRAALAFGARPPQLVPEAPERPPDSGPVEYTWKTPLCSCDSDEQAWQIYEMLRRAGIESWIEGNSTYAYTSGSQEGSFDDGNRRVLVAADQLDQARAIAAQPVPPDIVEESKAAPPEYEPPTCPRCGATDPLLEEVEPVNAWKCEVCGAEWSDPESDSNEGNNDVPKRG